MGVGRDRLQDDGRSASGSFKERASAVGVTRALAEGIADIACSSTGNAATSMAHCAAAIGMRSRIFVGRGVPEAKLAQMLAYGATVYQVDGAYNDAYMLCQKACKEFGWYDRNCALNPYLIEGKKTAGLEIAEQCADDPPDWVSISVGDGCSIAGVHKGMAEMKTLRIIGWSARMLGTQAAGVAPITALFEKTSTLDKYQASDTYADSINVPVPRNSRKALNAVRDSGGALVAVSDQQMMDAVAVCGRLSGVFAEPAAGAAIAGVAEARRRGILDSHSNVVILVTGNGLKDTRGALAAVGKPHAIPADLRAVEAIEKQLSSAAGAAR
jgi:threonine synthase